MAPPHLLFSISSSLLRALRAFAVQEREMLMTRAYPFVQVDVFTDRVFGGNPLAVVLDGRGLSDGEMQQIAREMNLSETTFLLPPTLPGCDARVRIFTPGREVP